jgi:hypothetical protein
MDVLNCILCSLDTNDGTLQRDAMRQ